MINRESIISLFDDKPTLMRWLRKVEAALASSVLTDVQAIQDGENVTLKFMFEDGTSITSSAMNLPRGKNIENVRTRSEQLPNGNTQVYVYYKLQGEAEAEAGNFTIQRGDGVRDLKINEDNEFIATLENGAEINTGAVSAGQLYSHVLKIGTGAGGNYREFYVNFYSPEPDPYDIEDIESGALAVWEHDPTRERIFAANGGAFDNNNVEVSNVVACKLYGRAQSESGASCYVFDARNAGHECDITYVEDLGGIASLAALKGEKGEKGEKGSLKLYRHSVTLEAYPQVKLVLMNKTSGAISIVDNTPYYAEKMLTFLSTSDTPYNNLGRPLQNAINPYFVLSTGIIYTLISFDQSGGLPRTFVCAKTNGYNESSYVLYANVVIENGNAIDVVTEVIN